MEGLDADCDCLLQIVLNYGKDMHTLRARSSDIPEDRGRTGYEEPPRQKETTIKVNELLKHSNHLDMCLKSSDEAYHHPFQNFYNLFAFFCACKLLYFSDRKLRREENLCLFCVCSALGPLGVSTLYVCSTCSLYIDLYVALQSDIDLIHLAQDY